MKLSASALMLLATGIGAYVVYKKKAGIIDALTPQSAAEKHVNNLYGPEQGWRNSPVYNTPGQPQYLPTLPASYAPGTDLSTVPIPPGAIEVIYLKTLASVKAPTVFPPPGSYYDLGAKPMSVDQAAGAAQLDTIAPFMYGLGDLEYDPGRRPRLYFHTVRIR